MLVLQYRVEDDQEQVVRVPGGISKSKPMSEIELPIVIIPKQQNFDREKVIVVRVAIDQNIQRLSAAQ